MRAIEVLMVLSSASDSLGNWLPMGLDRDLRGSEST